MSGAPCNITVDPIPLVKSLDLSIQKEGKHNPCEEKTTRSMKPNIPVSAYVRSHALVRAISSGVAIDIYCSKWRARLLNPVVFAVSLSPALKMNFSFALEIVNNGFIDIVPA